MDKFKILSLRGSAGSTRVGNGWKALLTLFALLMTGALPAWATPANADSPALAADNSTAGTGWRLDNKSPQTTEIGSISVIYPDIGEPYRSVFTQIIDGIETGVKAHVASYAVGPNVNAADLKDSLRARGTRVVIALGQRGMKIASGLDSSIGVVVGGVLTNSDISARPLLVNSLTPDPALLFARMKKMMPHVHRIFTVYDPRQNEWLIRLAKDGAAAQGLELLTYQAHDLRAAMYAYQKIFATADSEHDALWLPQDSTTVEESTVMPFVLQSSWTNDLAVFSSSFAHVKRGVLFSLYPDNVELGRHLAAVALNLLPSGDNETSSVVPLREVLMAVNLRTARHLGLDIDRLPRFDMAFPEQ